MFHVGTIPSVSVSLQVRGDGFASTFVRFQRVHVGVSGAASGQTRQDLAVAFFGILGW